MSALKFLLFIPITIVIFFFITLAWSYIQYKRQKTPKDIPIDNIPEFNYWNNKLNYFEDGVISVGFIVIFLLIAITVPLYVNMYNIKV